METTPLEVRAEVQIGASRETVWRAIVDPELTRQYVYGTRLRTTLVPGSRYAYVADGEVEAVNGEVLACEPGRRLVLTWAAHWDPEVEKDAPSRVSWELQDLGAGRTRLSVVHDRFAGRTATWASSKDAWTFLLSSLKSLVETGRPLEAA